MINYSLTPPVLLAGFVGVSVGKAAIRPRLTVARIQAVVAAFYEIHPSTMVSARRSHARPRQIAMYLAKELTPKSLPAIGGFFGGRDHTTVIHAINRIKELSAVDGDMAEDLDALRERLAA